MTNSPIFWIIAIIFIILATISIVWLKRNFRVQKVKFNTGMVETELERKKDEADKAEASVSDPSINISGNTMLGRNKVSVRREKTNVTKNKLVGKNKIEAGAKSGPKPKRKKKK